VTGATALAAALPHLPKLEVLGCVRVAALSALAMPFKLVFYAAGLTADSDLLPPPPRTHPNDPMPHPPCRLSECELGAEGAVVLAASLRHVPALRKLL
jgi:hypothetical protein